MDYTRGGAFYDPQNPYGNNRPTPIHQTPLGQYYFNNVAPEAAWTRRLAQLGRGGQDAVGQRSRGLYGQAASGYAAALGTNMDLKWTDYLDNLDLDAIEAQMSPSARGVDYAKTGGGLRWMGR